MKITVDSHLPKGWWKHPTIDIGTHHPAPYIWFIYWLITWDDPKDVWADFSLKNVRIRFMPD